METSLDSLSYIDTFSEWMSSTETWSLSLSFELQFIWNLLSTLSKPLSKSFSLKRSWLTWAFESCSAWPTIPLLTFFWFMQSPLLFPPRRTLYSFPNSTKLLVSSLCSKRDKSCWHICPGTVESKETIGAWLRNFSSSDIVSCEIDDIFELAKILGCSPSRRAKPQASLSVGLSVFLDSWLAWGMRFTKFPASPMSVDRDKFLRKEYLLTLHPTCCCLTPLSFKDKLTQQ